MSSAENQSAPGSFAKLMHAPPWSPVELTAQPRDIRANPARRSTKKKVTAGNQARVYASEETTASKQLGSHASTHASMLASKDASTIAEIRRAVKTPGTKTIFVRLTQAEKNRLVDLVYTYKRQEVKTSENELARIAISYLLAEYGERGKESMLARVIEALHA